MITPRDGWDPEERELLADAGDEIEALRARHQAGPPLELLRAARAGVLPDDLQAAVDRHLSASAWSRALVDGLGEDHAPLDADDTRRLLARIEEAVPKSPATAGWRRLRPLLLVPAAAAAALVGWMIVSDPDEGSTPPAPPASTTEIAPPPSPPPFVLPLDKPEVMLSMTTLTWRGPAGDNPLLAALKPGLDAYRQDDYATAARELAAIESRYPRSIEVLFYQGISRLFMNDAAGAIASFAAAEALDDATFADDVAFYRALAEQRAGNLTAARARLEALCGRTGARASSACAAIEQLASASSTPR